MTGPILAGPAELIVWNAKTGKAIARQEFPTSELDFVAVHFSPDSKFLVALSREGQDRKERKLVAFGQTPFNRSGGKALNFPADLPPKPKSAAVVAKGGIVSDPLDRLIDELAKSHKTVEVKVDALFLASLGRFATASEQKRVKDKYGDKLSADALRKLLTEIAATPEFDAHVKSLEKRAPAKSGLAPIYPNWWNPSPWQMWPMYPYSFPAFPPNGAFSGAAPAKP
jgi:hypothetical protein